MESPQEPPQITPDPVSPAPPQIERKFPILWIVIGIVIFLLVCGGAYAAWTANLLHVPFIPNTNATSEDSGDKVGFEYDKTTRVSVQWLPLSQAQNSEFVSTTSGVNFESAYYGGYYNGNIANADSSSFSVAYLQIGSTTTYALDYAKDKNNVYLRNTVLENADPNTFALLPVKDTSTIVQYNPWSVVYGKDKSRVYFRGEVVPGADPASFVSLTCALMPEGACETSYAKDAHRAYRDDKVWADPDPKTLDTVYGPILKDKNRIFKIGYGTCAECESIDVTTFVSLGRGYFKDKNRIYDGTQPIEGADPTSFAVLGDDPITFTTRSIYAKDAKRVYDGTRVIDGADPDTFEVIPGFNDWYAKDKNHVYIRGYVEKELDPSTFSVINQNYSKDKDTVYLELLFDPAGVIPNADPNTFEFIPIQGTQAGTFAPIESEWSKDTIHVYFLNSLLPGADPKTFVALSGRLGKDNSHAYCMERLISGADATTFIASSTDAWAGQDKNHRYDCEKIVQ